MTQPAADLADGSIKVVWVATLADPSAPTATEVNAGTTVDLSCYLTGDGWSQTTDESAVTDDRLCSRKIFERPGRSTDHVDLKYVYRAQAPLASDNKAYITLRDRTEGFLVSRYGRDYEDALAAADIVDVIPAQCGVQQKLPREDNGVLKIGQKVYVTGEIQRDVAIAA
jgi:hypothetical protein